MITYKEFKENIILKNYVFYFQLITLKFNIYDTKFERSLKKIFSKIILSFYKKY